MTGLPDAPLDSAARARIEREALAPYLRAQRWFGGKARDIASVRFADWARGARFAGAKDRAWVSGLVLDVLGELLGLSAAEIDALRQERIRTEAIASWNADTPDGAWVETLVRARFGSRWSKWYNLGIWAAGRPTARARRLAADRTVSRPETAAVPAFRCSGASLELADEREVRRDELHLDLDGYEGPIDVLLTLARDQKVDLTKISILQLADQYLEFITAARRLRLELAVSSEHGLSSAA